MQRARQFANKFLQLEPALIAVIPPADIFGTASIDLQPYGPAISVPPATTTAISTTCPTPAPATFTISYTPLSISYPDPIDPTTPLETDAVRVTRHELAAMLQQSYIHGSEHGWKATGQQQLQAKYDNDIRAAVSKLDTTMAQIRQRGFDCGFKEGKIQLKARYEKQQLDMLHNFAERAQEISEQDFNRGFNDGRDAGIREEVERRESTRAELADCGMQTEPPQHKQSFSVNFSMQTEPPEPEHILRINFGTQTEPPEPASSVASPELLPIAAASSDRGLEPPSMPSLSPSTCSPNHDFDASTSSIDSIPIPLSKIQLLASKSLRTAATALSEPHMPKSDPSSPSVLLPTTSSAPAISTSFPSRDFSDLRSGANPWQSLQRRKGRDRRRSAQPFIQHQRRSYTRNLYSNIPRNHISKISNTPYPSPLNLPAPLDWDSDPRLYELSRVLQTLGWVSPSTSRP